MERQKRKRKRNIRKEIRKKKTTVNLEKEGKKLKKTSRSNEGSLKLTLTRLTVMGLALYYFSYSSKHHCKLKVIAPILLKWKL